MKGSQIYLLPFVQKKKKEKIDNIWVKYGLKPIMQHPFESCMC